MSIINKQIESQVLNDEVEKFLTDGGSITVFQPGYSSGVHTKPMRSIMAASVESAQIRKVNPNVIARNEARKKGLIHYNGASCSVCGSTLRYTSTNSCFPCNKAQSLLRAQRRRNERKS